MNIRNKLMTVCKIRKHSKNINQVFYFLLDPYLQNRIWELCKLNDFIVNLLVQSALPVDTKSLQIMGNHNRPWQEALNHQREDVNLWTFVLFSYFHSSTGILSQNQFPCCHWFYNNGSFVVRFCSYRYTTTFVGDFRPSTFLFEGVNLGDLLWVIFEVASQTTWGGFRAREVCWCFCQVLDKQ